MLDLSRKLIDEVYIKGKLYQMNISFNSVLKIMELVTDDNVSDNLKSFIALQILTKHDFSKELTVKEAADTFTDIFKNYIQLTKEETVYDLKGNLIKSKSSAKQKSQRIFSLKHDADYIYASFMQAYGIDLIDVQNVLHWKKFNALLNGLPSNTKFVEVIKIRSWVPQKNDSKKYKDNMRAMQKQYTLPSSFSY